eukprot:symbB.v1.2.016292.t1/scaffold1236.1/size130149/10
MLEETYCLVEPFALGGALFVCFRVQCHVSVSKHFPHLWTNCAALRRASSSHRPCTQLSLLYFLGATCGYPEASLKEVQSILNGGIQGEN